MTDLKFDGFDAYEMDENLESGEGVRVEYDDGRAFILHRAGGSNRKFGRLLQAKMKPVQRRVETGTLPDSVAERILRDCYAEAVIVGWDGITAGGKAVPFSKENVLAFLEQQPEVFRAIQRDANDLALFRAEEREADLGNLPTTPDGSGSGDATKTG